jgi:predicted nucleic acid-binding Zn ribbon protein
MRIRRGDFSENMIFRGSGFYITENKRVSTRREQNRQKVRGQAKR